MIESEALKRATLEFCNLAYTTIEGEYPRFMRMAFIDKVHLARTYANGHAGDAEKAMIDGWRGETSVDDWVAETLGMDMGFMQARQALMGLYGAAVAAIDTATEETLIPSIQGLVAQASALIKQLTEDENSQENLIAELEFMVADWMAPPPEVIVIDHSQDKPEEKTSLFVDEEE